MNARGQILTRTFGALALSIALLAAAPAAGASAANPAPAFRVGVTAMPSNFAPGAQGTLGSGPRYNIRVANIGEKATGGPVTITATLPTGLTPAGLSQGCSAAGQVVTCTTEDLFPGAINQVELSVDVAVLPDPTVLEPTEVTVTSLGAAPAVATAATTITEEEAPFGFDSGASGLGAWLTEADGSAATAAGSHPSQFTVNVGFNTRRGNRAGTTILTSGAGARDVFTDLPPGLVVDPAAIPARCTEEQFETTTCPDEAVVGRANVGLSFAGEAAFSETPLYNLVPPPGAASSFGFDPGGTGLHAHVLGGLRPGDYTIRGAVKDIPALFEHPIYNSQLQIWGDPSSESHDHTRGNCINRNVNGETNTCPVPHHDFAAVTLPTACSSSLQIEAQIDSWANPSQFVSRSTPLTDLAGTPTGVSGCNAVPFNPSLSVQPTTNLADSPSGLDVDLAIPQSNSRLGTASAHLKEAVVTLPEGLVVNPASANGLAGCSPAQVGIDSATGVANGQAPTCPDASKIGSVTLESPLLAQYNSEDKVQRDANGQAIAEPIPGSVYVATPHDNPFGSLLAIYVVLDDPAHGILVKLAGEVRADPVTGRLTTTFASNPQLPFSHFKLHFFSGASAALRTPLTCGTKTVTSDLTPWSTPEGANATPSDSFLTAVEPGGGACPASADQAANHPAFSSGTLAPQAGAYSPLVLKLAREDGTAPITGIDTTMPPGLTGKLAGIAECPDGALAAAAAKTGAAETQTPSCPASSLVGTAVVGAGAGPTPYYTSGRAYLAGPYKGAPLSLAIVTPATAGPYDLGTVVVRTALFVDPETARIHAVSDPIPQILQGIPLDVRSIALRVDRPSFTLNPTSCDPFAVTGSASAAAVAPAALTSPFQVGGCSALAFKPKLAIALEGGTKRSDNPALKAVLTMPAAGANIAAASVALPHSEFLDQAHIRTVCTRVQFAAGAGNGAGCPAGSVYGTARAITPLLDAPLEGPVFLRSNPEHELPDLVAALNGQIDVVLVGRIDSHKGGIRTTFEGVPDAPVSKFVLEMQGGKKGLLENSVNLCKSTNRATALFDGQNGKVNDFKPVVKAKCRKGSKGKGKKRSRGRR